jgi:tripartite-type tricarboxylate transporter receptor subunit TctC
MKNSIATVCGLILAIMSGTASAQNYPAKGVKIVVPLGTGSASDAMTRIAAQKLNELWAQPVVVENQPGANGIPATAAVVKSPPDGYTLMIIAANHVINTSLFGKLPYDAMRDIKPIARMGFTPLLMVAHPSVPVRNVKEFIALAKSKPGQLNYGSAGNGSPTHLTGELFQSMTGIKTVHIPYKIVANAQTDVVGGQIEFLFVVPSFAIPQIQAGRLRGLGVASLKRMPQMPELPTIDEAGVPGFEVLAWIGIAGPGQISDEVVNKVATDMLRVLGMPDVRDRINTLGLEISTMPPREFQDYVVKEQAKWAKVVRESGAKAD